MRPHTQRTTFLTGSMVLPSENGRQQLGNGGDDSCDNGRGRNDAEGFCVEYVVTVLVLAKADNVNIGGTDSGGGADSSGLDVGTDECDGVPYGSGSENHVWAAFSLLTVSLSLASTWRILLTRLLVTESSVVVGRGASRSGRALQGGGTLRFD